MEKNIEHNHCACGHDHGHDGHEHGGENIKSVYLRLILGAVIFAAGLFLEHLFEVNKYIYLAVYIVAYLILGGEVIISALKNIARGRLFDENFLMTVATVGAFIIGEYAEGAGVMLFYIVGELFQGLAVGRAKKSIKSLMSIRPDSANLIKDGAFLSVAPESVEIGDLIFVKAGERIPLDGVVTDGYASIDTSALTGESRPIEVASGDSVLSGSVNMTGALTIKVTKSFGESTVSKIIDLVENAAERKSPVENFITKFARIYTPIVILLAALISIVPPLFIGIGNLSVWSEWVRRGLIFLVISCPCALVVSIPLGFFGGIGGASRRGILIKGGNYLEALNKLEIAVFDKTGTLTEGSFKIIDISTSNGFSKEDVLLAAAKAEAFSNHHIALSIRNELGKEIDKSSLTDYTEIAGRGIKVIDAGKVILAGNEKLLLSENIDFQEVGGSGTKVYVAVENKYAGCIIIGDKIKEDSAPLISFLKERGIRTVMLSGDNSETAAHVAAEIGIDEVYAGLLPDGKVEKVEMLCGQKSKAGTLSFMGDGINDAPVLALSDIGISMGGLGSDAAIEAADIIIMTDEPSKLTAAMDIAKKTRKIIWQNIIFALAVKAVFLILSALGFTTMWAAVFADVGVSLLAVLNALRAIGTKGKH